MISFVRFLAVFALALCPESKLFASGHEKKDCTVHFTRPRQIPEEEVFRHERWQLALLARIYEEKRTTTFPGGVIGRAERFPKAAEIKPRNIRGKANFGCSPML